MLQRLGIVTATSGLTPELLAVLESMTAQRQLGFCPILLTWRQQLLETGAFTSWAADMQGASLKASLSGETFPHSLAPSTLPEVMKMLMRTTMSSRRVKFQLFIGVSMTCKIYRKSVDIGGVGGRIYNGAKRHPKLRTRRRAQISSEGGGSTERKMSFVY